MKGALLESGFYQVRSEKRTDTTIETVVSLNIEHPIFLGHFPGKPLTPGVCEVQLIQEAVSRQLQQRIRLQRASVVKFIQPIYPLQTADLTIDTVLSSTEETIQVKATIRDASCTYCRFTGEYLTLNS